MFSYLLFKYNQVSAALVGVFIGFMLAILLVALSGALFLWLYGSFWTTVLVIVIGGDSFTILHV